MTQDIPPKDSEILAVLHDTPEGLTARALMDALNAKGYTPENVVRAIQRVFDRGLVDLGPAAKLRPVQIEMPAAA